MKTLIEQANEIKAAIDHCFVGCTESRADKTRAFIVCMDMFDQWRDQWARDYLKALETADLSPTAFSASRNHSISVQ